MINQMRNVFEAFQQIREHKMSLNQTFTNVELYQSAP